MCADAHSGMRPNCKCAYRSFIHKAVVESVGRIEGTIGSNVIAAYVPIRMRC